MVTPYPAYNDIRCPNKDKHVSAFPAFDRELCPYCRKVYILKVKDDRQ